MTEVYSNDFIDMSEVALCHQLRNYVINVQPDLKFAKLKGFLDFEQNLWKQIIATHLLWFISF